MKLLKESIIMEDFEEEDDVVVVGEVKPEIVDEGNPIYNDVVLADDSLVAEVESGSEGPVEVKTITSTSVEVLDSFTEVREEMAKDTYEQFKSGSLSVIDLNKRLAALCGSYEAAMKWLKDHETEEVEVVITTEEVPVEVAEDEVEIEIPVETSLDESLKTLQKLAESSPEAKSALGQVLKLLKEDINVDKVEVEIEAPEGEEEKKEESEAEEIAETPNPPEVGLDTAVANELNKMIIGELNTINDYNNLIEMLVANKTNVEILNVIKDINSEEHEHIGQLQQCLKQVSPNAIKMEAGQAEGAKQIASPVDIGDPSVDGTLPSEEVLEKDTLLSPEEAKKDEGEANKL